ncbi:hypothetical protein CEUSTIGMA_g7872.t1 [Chlamydomonas eustigma]|uniref:Uncharacterized protein n=1 Tax=Chlamydomonas eustigma TaxID=1157962 RepID=A0A250XBG7_9CHLO|nr:hypothetical protein CEUSTIGMA_g7872.t1 [Chlamydomonas eustigma]|eukprot:GAX80433.1 hypothetical protein CEUSTIGMA_g7872.t1 [Chlamydomonas eustigma]
MHSKLYSDMSQLAFIAGNLLRQRLALFASSSVNFSSLGLLSGLTFKHEEVSKSCAELATWVPVLSVAAALALSSAPRPMSCHAEELKVEALPSNNPFDYDPGVTNEHTALMTLARAAALEYYQAGKFKLAETKFLEALSEAKIGFDARDPHIASCQNNLAEFYRNTKQYDKAEDLYKQALGHLEMSFGEKHWLYVSTMHNLALMYEASGQYQNALDSMQHVLKLRLQMFGSRSFLYADSMFALGQITRKAGGKGSEEKALQLMRDAVGILEDAESVQVNVILLWLQDLASELRRSGKSGEAALYLRKALHYMSEEKGEVLSQASALSDTLVDCLTQSKQFQAAHDAMVACLGARVQLFGRDLAVVQTMCKLAGIEEQLGRQEAAMQNVGNAISLGRELLQQYSSTAAGASSAWSTMSSWIKGDTDANRRVQVKQVQAAHLLGGSLMQLAGLQTTNLNLKKNPSSKSNEPLNEAAEKALLEACEVLKVASEIAVQLVQEYAKSTASNSMSVSLIEELTTLYIETTLKRIESLDKIASICMKRGDKERAEGLQKISEELANKLVAQTT